MANNVWDELRELRQAIARLEHWCEEHEQAQALHEARLSDRVEKLLELKQGPPGERGKPGPAGLDGLNGRDGQNAATVIREVKISG